MIATIIIIFFLGCIFIGFLNIQKTKSNKIFLIGATLSISILYALGITSVINNRNTIPAIEVYRGNTTLQITYKDSIPIDSVVVDKNK